MGKSSINGPFSMAMLNNQRVTSAGSPYASPPRRPRLQLRGRDFLQPSFCRPQQLRIAVHAQVVQPRTWRRWKPSQFQPWIPW